MPANKIPPPPPAREFLNKHLSTRLGLVSSIFQGIKMHQTSEKFFQQVENKLKISDSKLGKFLKDKGLQTSSSDSPNPYFEASKKAIDFIRISHIAYDRTQELNDTLLLDFQQLLSLVYSSASNADNFVYILENDPNKGCNLYLGSSNLDAISLQKAFKGIYAGSITHHETPPPPQSRDFSHIQALAGVPSLKRDSDKSYKQSLEKFLSPLQDHSFRLTLIAKSYSTQDIHEIIANLQELASQIHKKVRIAQGYSKGYSDSNGTNTESGESGHGNTKTTNTESKSSNEGVSCNIDNLNKEAEFYEELVNHDIKRFQHGLSHGMWNVSAYIQADNESTLMMACQTFKSVYSGEDSHYEPLRAIPIRNTTERFPMLRASSSGESIHITFSQFSTAMNTQELSIISALPQNDIHGISVSRLSSFGLTQSHATLNHSRGEHIELGTILSRKTPTPQRFYLSPEAINSHIFVCGVTGSGKSNTIKHILTQLQSNPTLDKHIPFLVIEPAKSEYKHLINKIDRLQVFRPGCKGDTFMLNPFVFDFSRNNHAVTLTKHVDMLKTTFSSAFPMYGPMPYILEDALHRIYEDRGWDFDTECNRYFDTSDCPDYSHNSLLFPTMEDLKDRIDKVAEEAGYAKELDSNFKAALKTRIKNLTLGVKGKIFNSRHAIDSKTLFENPTIIELSHISDDAEKSFLMGLILNKLYHYRESQGDSGGELKHVCIIEEAHRLLPNIPLDRGEEANAKGQAVETFVNMLAEIRSYGQGLIITDQIASKLHPDIVKNTNIKILQRTMDKEDRELIGNAINLDENQIRDIAELQTGEAIVHHKDIHQAFMMKIDELKTGVASEESLNEFTQNFLDNHENYKYDFIGEKKHHIPQFDYSKIKAIDKDDLRHSFLQLLNAILLDQDYQDKKEAFFSLYKTTNTNEYFYLFIRVWRSLNYLSNINYYANIDDYFIVYLSTRDLILNLCATGEDHQDAINAFKKHFTPKTFKRFFPVHLEGYDENRLHLILLGLENLKSRNLASEALVAIKDKNQIEPLTKQVFGISGQEQLKVVIFICSNKNNFISKNKE